MKNPELSSLTPRTATLGQIEGLANQSSPELSCELFRLICFSRAFEWRVKAEAERGNVNCLVYLSLGQESIAAGVAAALRAQKPWILGQHRAHATYLSFGGARVPLVDELLGLPGGCCGGMAGSPPIHDIANRIIGHVGLIGDQVPVAAGVALTNPGDQVICFFGDGAAEEDYVLAALGFAATRRLNILFVCEDNDLSVLTPTSVRRNWNIADVATSFGLESVEIADDPWLVSYWADRLKGRPALMNVKTCREIWHVGTGNDGPPEWDRFQLTRETMAHIGLGRNARSIEDRATAEIEELWAKRLQIQSVS
ncbi:MAG: thiamine pyrophosphate-dependent enzyme [Alphaproteobacteria bacterium]